MIEGRIGPGTTGPIKQKGVGFGRRPSCACKAPLNP